MAQDTPPSPVPGRGPALLSHGFRPFFLGAGIYAALGMLGWLAAVGGGIALPWTPAPPVWHAHEMLAG